MEDDPIPNDYVATIGSEPVPPTICMDHPSGNQQSSDPSGVTTEFKLHSDVEIEDEPDSVYSSELQPVLSQHDSFGNPTKDAGLEDVTCSQPTNLTARKRPLARKDGRCSKRRVFGEPTNPSAVEVQRLFILYFIVIVL